jgi:hypothetical protein
MAENIFFIFFCLNHKTNILNIVPAIFVSLYNISEQISFIELIPEIFKLIKSSRYQTLTRAQNLRNATLVTYKNIFLLIVTSLSILK